MKVKLLVLLIVFCAAPAVQASLFVWGGGGTDTAMYFWNDTTADADGVNADADHWGVDASPNIAGADQVIIPAGGVQKTSVLLENGSSITILGGYFYTAGCDAGVTSGAGSFTIEDGYANCQWIGSYPGASFDIRGGTVNIRGGGQPLPVRTVDGVTGYINFSGNAGVITAPNKSADPVYIEGKILAGIVRIDGVVLAAVNQVVNDKHFELSDGGTTLTLVSAKAYGPGPRMNAVEVPVDQVLTWSTGRDPNNLSQPNPAITKHFVWMSNGDPKDPNVFHVATVDASGPAEYTPATELIRDGVYYWRIDEGIADYPVGDPNNIIGSVWQFTTLPSTPIIDAATPDGSLVASGEDAQMTVSVINPLTGDPNGLDYEWYKVGTPDVLVGTNSATLTIEGADIDDEGLYYCKAIVASSGGFSISGDARVTIKRLIGHWPFDGSLEDIVYENDGTADPVEYVPGIVGDAVTFSLGSVPVEIPTAAHKNRAWSLSFWEKTNPDVGGGEWEAMIGSGATTGFEVLEIDRYRSNRFAAGVSGGFVYSDATNPFSRDTWNYVVVTFDGDSSLTTLYVNGEPAGTATSSGFNSLDASLFIGNVRDGSQPYPGAIDDLKLYNYPLSAVEVASRYTDIRPEAVLCLGKPARDLDDDCDVDIDDLVIFVSGWLDCGKFPNCAD